MRIMNKISFDLFTKNYQKTKILQDFSKQYI